MLWATYTQQLDPLADKVFWSPLWSTILAGLPVLVLFWLLVPRRWLAPKAGAAGAVTAILVAIIVFGMPAEELERRVEHGSLSAGSATSSSSTSASTSALRQASSSASRPA